MSTWDNGNSDGWGSGTPSTAGSGWGASASSDGSGWGGSDVGGMSNRGWGGASTSDYLSSSSSWDNTTTLAPDSGTITWLPAWLALGSALLALGALYRAFSLEAANSKITFGIAAYILGALFANILFNLQRAKEIQGCSAGKRRKYLGNISAVNLATAAMIVGLLAAIAAAVIVATEWARY